MILYVTVVFKVGITIVYKNKCICAYDCIFFEHKKLKIKKDANYVNTWALISHTCDEEKFFSYRKDNLIFKNTMRVWKYCSIDEGAGTKPDNLAATL